MLLWFITWKSTGWFPKKLPERTFQMQLRIRQGRGIHLFQPWIFLFISGRCVPEHLFFFLVIADLICKHLVIDKAAAADCLLYLNSLLFIWIDPYFYGAVHSSHPGFLYTAVSFQSLLRLHWADRRSDSRMHLSWSNSIIFIILFLIPTDMYLWTNCSFFSILHQGRENKCFFYTIEIFLSRYDQMCNSSHHLKRWENSCYIC